jgi:hypothetical protein
MSPWQIFYSAKMLSYTHDSAIKKNFVLSLHVSLKHSNISDAGAQALAEGLQHCSNLQMLE